MPRQRFLCGPFAQLCSHLAVTVKHNLHLRQMNDHLPHCVQQKIRPFLAGQPSQKTDPQRCRVADNDSPLIIGRGHAVWNAYHPFRRVAQRQRGAILFAGHRNDRRRPVACQVFDPAIKRTPPPPAHHQEWKGVRGIDDRHAAEPSRNPGERAGF